MAETTLVLAAGAGTFAFTLQSSAVLVALPYISPLLRGFVSAHWTATIYLFSITASLLVCGRLGDTFGSRRVYLFGMILFTVGACCCATTRHPIVFLLSRGLQGVGAALAAANSPAVMTRWLPGNRYGYGFGWQAALTYLGLCLGPAAAAALITRFGWRSIFWMEFPVGAAATALGFKFMPPDAQSASGKLSIPAVSGSLWAICLLPLLTLLTQGTRWGWTSSRVLSLFAIWGIAIACFGLHEMRAKAPLLNLQVLRHPAIPLCLASELLLYFCIYVIGFLVPLLFFRGSSSRATVAGLILSIEGVARLIGALAAGSATDRNGSLPIAIAGSGCVLAGCVFFCVAGISAQVWIFAAAAALTGLGAGMFVPANSLRLFANVPTDSHGLAAGVFATVRNLGMMIGMACAGGLTLPFGYSVGSSPAAIRLGFSIISFIAGSILIAHLIVRIYALRLARRGISETQGSAQFPLPDSR